MATQAVIGVGVQLQRGDGGSPEVFTTLSEVTEIKGGEKVDTADATSFDSTGGYKEFISTLIDPGELDMVMHYIPGNAQQLLLEADLRARTLKNWRIVNNAHTRSFAGIVIEFMPTITVAGIQMASLKIKVSGAISDT